MPSLKSSHGDTGPPFLFVIYQIETGPCDRDVLQIVLQIEIMTLGLVSLYYMAFFLMTVITLRLTALALYRKPSKFNAPPPIT